VAEIKDQRRAQQIQALKKENRQLRRELSKSRDKATAQKEKEHVTAVVTKVEPNNQVSASIPWTSLQDDALLSFKARANRHTTRPASLPISQKRSKIKPNKSQLQPANVNVAPER
jgi:hypothetical protein